MPRVKSSDPFEQRRRDTSAWIRGGMERAGIKRFEDLSKRTGIPKSTLAKRCREPGTLIAEEQWKLEKVIGRLEVN